MIKKQKGKKGALLVSCSELLNFFSGRHFRNTHGDKETVPGKDHGPCLW